MKPIVFTHLNPDLFQYKASIALRKKGCKTIAVCLKKPNSEISSAFDKVISLKLKNLKPKTLLFQLLFKPKTVLSFFYNLFIINPEVAICQAPPHYLSSIFILFFKRKCKAIYFPYDMISTRYKKPEKYNRKIEIIGEKSAFKNCDAIICKTALEEFDLLPEHLKKYIKDKPKLIFHVYPLKELFTSKKEKLSKKDKQIHLVYTGGFRSNTPLYRDIPEYSKEMLNQGFHLHMYCHRDKPTEHDINILTKNRKYIRQLHLAEKFVPIKDFSDELSKYDYGLDAFFFSNISKKGIISGTSKFSSYLEAGLPVIMNKEKKLFSDIIKKNKIGIVTEDYNFKDLKEKIKKADYNKLTKNVLNFREEYSFENNINRLISFINSLAKEDINQAI